MPYSPAHAQNTRSKIVETARRLFNQHGFHQVTIDMVMQKAGLTRGGFYNHFKNKEALFNEAVASFLMGRGAEWRGNAGIDVTNLKPDMAQKMVDAYLSDDHLEDTEGQCPMIALPSDVARADDATRDSFETLLSAMTWLLEAASPENKPDRHQDALATAALCVGGMVLARALPDSDLAHDIRLAAHKAATETLKAPPS